MQEARDRIFSHHKIEGGMYSSSLLTATKAWVGLKAESFTITYILSSDHGTVHKGSLVMRCHSNVNLLSYSC